MITREDDVDIHALRRQGWTITAIAHHVGRDRKTVRNYLNGKREPGVRRRATDPFAPFVEYVTARLVEDPHLWAITLFDELEALGFTASYQSLTREIRARKLRPVCTDCGRATERANAVIAHPAGEETQWDWLDLPDPPGQLGVGVDGASAGRLTGALGTVARLPVGVDGSAASGRGPGPDQLGSGRGHPTVAVRPDGDGLPTRLAGSPPPSPGGEALRRHDQDLPTPSRDRKGVGYCVRPAQRSATGASRTRFGSG